MSATDGLPVVRDQRGKKEHGSFSVGTSAVVLQAADSKLLSLWIQVDGPGKVRPGTSTVANTPNAPAIKAGGDLILDRSNDATWIIADQVGTTGTWLREVED